MWPENMCQWNCSGRPVISYFPTIVDGSHTSERFAAQCRCCFPHTLKSLTKKRTSVPDKRPIGDTNRDKLFPDSTCQLSNNENPKNSTAKFVGLEVWLAQFQ